MRIAVMVANRTGWLCLDELLCMGEEVVAIFTTPPHVNISYSDKPIELVTHKTLDDLAKTNGIPLVTITGQMGQYVETLRKFNPDMVLVCGWYHMIPPKMLAVPPSGVIGFHPSLLPKYRGGAPLTWALINDERETGITMFYFDEGVDSGDVIAQERVTIDDHDTIATLYNKINRAMLAMVRKMMPQLRQGVVARYEQDESQATFFPQRSPGDGLIDWARPSRAIYNWIRAQTTPYPGAYTYLGSQKLTVWAAELLKHPNNSVPGMSGYVIRLHPGGGVEVLTGDGSLLVTEVDLGGQRALASDVLRRVGLGLGFHTPDMIAALAALPMDRERNFP